MFLIFFFQDEPEPISVYHPIAKELSASMGTPMEGFFDGADMVFEAATPAPLAAAQEVLAEAFIPSTEPVPIGEGTHTEGISETALIPRHLLPKREPFLMLYFRPRLLLLPYLSLSLPMTPSPLYLRS